MPRFRATRAQSEIAVICGTPTPATMRVVQMDPGPMPTLMASAPASMSASDASAVFGALSDAEPPTPAAYTLAPTPAVRQRNDARLDRVLRLATLAAWGDSLMGKTYASRGDGVADRALASIRFGIALADLGGAENLEAYAAAAAQRGRVAAYLSRLITDLAPVITVNAPVRLPSLYWAWRLYEDPTRAAELVARNAIRHPAHMPPSFQALAS